jgi:ABC-type cobalamin/Fe3+-siderophores transport system ATPase subunit
MALAQGTDVLLFDESDVTVGVVLHDFDQASRYADTH